MASSTRALVTGAASGIGKAVAQRYGPDVALLDLSEAVSDVASSLGGHGFTVDVADAAAVKAAVDDAADALEGFDVVVNCAGWDRAMPFADTDEQFWRRVVDINLIGVLAVTHASLPYLGEGSSIVNVASDAGRVGSSGEVAYSAAKGGVIAFSKALARELAREGIRVNAVAPGPTDTPFLSSFDESGRLAQAMTAQTPLRKLATPDDVASAVCFLASAEAGHITGQVLSVSGGLTMV